MKKQDVYVVIDTPKKAKKVKKVLDMFGESVYSKPNHEIAQHNGVHENWRYGFSEGYWQGFNTKSFENNKKVFKKVSINQLRKILAKEHLKVGDYFVDCNKYIFVLNKINEDGTINCSCLTHNTKGDLSYEDFKRYATPEEIELLEPKPKELVVGKWYKGNYNNTKYLAFPTELHKETIIRGYGFDDEGVWKLFNNNAWIGKNTRLATPKEVEQALIEEAKRRYKVGCSVLRSSDILIINGTPNANEIEHLSEDDCNFYYCEKRNALLTKQGCVVFIMGKWASVIKNDDKFAELKEAHKNGAVIQFKSHFEPFEWIDVHNNNPSWQKEYEYRIKPEEKPKVGDWVSYKAGDIRKVTEITNRNLQHYLKHPCEIIKDIILIEKLRGI